MDERLRTLQRQAAAGDPDADANLLRHRLAMGELTIRQLRFAALLGHEPSQWIYEKTPRVKTGCGVQKWLRAIRIYGGAEAGARANLAAAEFLLPRWERFFPEDTRPHEVIAVAWTCVKDPTTENARLARRTANHAQAYFRALEPMWRTAGDVEAARRAMALQAGYASTLAGLEAAALVGDRTVGPFGSAVEIATDLESQSQVRRAVTRALVPWALGTD